MMLQLQLLRQSQSRNQLRLHQEAQEAITMVTITMMTITLMQLPRLLQLQFLEAFACNLAVPLSSEFCFSHMWEFYHEHF
jgi:hypothetical protein